MPSVEHFVGELYKLKGFFTQVKIKITNKSPRLPMSIKQIAYTGLFLLGKVLE